MGSRRKRARAQAAPTEAERHAAALRESLHYVTPREVDDPVPEDMDVFRLALTRRILTLCDLPRRCREPVCRRNKRCLGPDLRCQRDFPETPSTPDQEAAVKAAFLRRLALLGDGG
jgi:hypothetical protein